MEAPAGAFSKVTILPGFKSPLVSYLYLAMSCTLSAAIAASALDVVHVRIGDADSDLAAVVNHFVQALLGGKADYGNGAGKDNTLGVLHKFEMQ